MTHQKPAGELSGGLFVFARGAMHRQLLPAADGEREFWKRPSPSRLRRATSPERERLWQGRKVYSLTAGFFLPLTGEDETCPLCQRLPLRGSCRRRRLRGFVPPSPRIYPTHKKRPVRMHGPFLQSFLKKRGEAFSFPLTPAPGERRSAGRDTRRHRRGYRPGRRCPHPPAAAGA